jgi:site-specific DNA-adenine methylase
MGQLAELTFVRQGELTEWGRFLLADPEAFTQTAGAAGALGKPLPHLVRTESPQARSLMSSLFPWLGGKGRLAKRILDRMPPHDTYCELFAGSAAILLARPGLAQVVVECLPWMDCLRRYDRLETLFFIDPPYWQTEGYAIPPLSLDDYRDMADALAGIRGRAVVTLNDHPEMREIFGRFRHEVVELAQFGGPEERRGQRRRELIFYTW